MNPVFKILVRTLSYVYYVFMEYVKYFIYSSKAVVGVDPPMGVQYIYTPQNN